MTSWRSRLLFRVYNVLVLVALPLVVLGILIRWRGRLAGGMKRWDERWGRLSSDTLAVLQREIQADRSNWWWVHAVSVGEVKAIESFLLRAPVLQNARIVLTVVTPEAIAYASERKLAELVLAAPIDLPWIVRRVARAIRPGLFVSVESEFWPNLLREAKRSGARVALINGRLSARSYRRYRKIRFVLRALWECFDVLAVREPQDVERFAGLGVPADKIKLTGNLKYDLLGDGSTRMRSALNYATLVLGSTREGEERLLLPILRSLQAKHPSLSIVWAPRHLQRIPELEALFQSESIAFRRKSAYNLNGCFDAAATPNILWDSMGDLMDAYRRADIALIGGSFVEKGGQNPIEPASLGVPVIFGPSMDNFRAIAESMVEGGGARQVALAELQACLDELISDMTLRDTMGRHARASVERQQGATDRTLDLLKGLRRA